MNARKLALLIVAGLIAYGAFHVSQRKAPSTDVGNALLYPGLLDRINDTRSVRIETADGGFTLARDGDKWSMAERNGYPAHADKVRESLMQLAGLRIRETKTSKPENYATLGVADGDARRVIVQDAEGGALLDLLVGKARQARGVEEPGHYVRRQGEATAYLVEGELGLPADRNEWTDTAIVDLPVDRVRQVTINHQGAQPVTVSKQSRMEQLFTLQDPPEGYDARSSAVVSSIGGLLLDVRLEDVIAASRLEGMTPRTIVEVQTFDGLVATLEQYDHEGRVFVVFDFSFNPDLVVPADAAPAPADAAGAQSPPVAAPAETSAPSADEVRAEIEKLNGKLRGWAYELPDYKTRIIDKKMEDLIKVKQAAPPPVEPIETME